MKFTKEEAYKELVALLTAKGEKLNLSERSINEQLDALIPLIANEETELADFTSKVFSVFKTADANVRNDVSVGITKYKEEHPIKTQEPKDGKKEEDEQLSEYVKRIEALEAKLAKEDENRVISGIKNNLTSKLKEKGIKDVEWINSLIDEVSITTDFKVEDKVDAYVQLYNKSKSQTPLVVTPKGGGGSADVNKYIEDAIAQAATIA